MTIHAKCAEHKLMGSKSKTIRHYIASSTGEQAAVQSYDKRSVLIVSFKRAADKSVVAFLAAIDNIGKEIRLIFDYSACSSARVLGTAE